MVNALAGWETHKKVYELMGLKTSLCQLIDRIVDEDTPRVKEVIPDADVGEYERLRSNFGLTKNEFPYMYRYVLRMYGVEGVKCLLTHFIIDKIENDLRRGYTQEMIMNTVESLLTEYDSECRINKDYCNNYSEVVREVKKALEPHLTVVVNTVKEWLEGRILPVDVVVNASSRILSLILKTNLYLKGYRGKRGFTTDKRVFAKTFANAKRILKQKLYETSVSGGIRDLNAVLESINSIKQQLAGRGSITVSEYMKLLSKEQERSYDFKVFIKILRDAVAQAISEFEGGGKSR